MLSVLKAMIFSTRGSLAKKVLGNSFQVTDKTVKRLYFLQELLEDQLYIKFALVTPTFCLAAEMNELLQCFHCYLTYCLSLVYHCLNWNICILTVFFLANLLLMLLNRVRTV